MAAPLALESQIFKRDIEQGKQIFKDSGLEAELRPGFLGRAKEGRSSDISSIIEKRRAGLSGISAEENQALREQMTKGIDTGTQTSLRQLRGAQGVSGVRGGSALSAQAGLLKAGQESKANVERDLLIKNIEAKRAALGDFEQSVIGAESTERDKEIFNIERAAQEKTARLTSQLGFSQAIGAERSGIRGQQAAQANMAAQGGKK